MVDSDDWVDEKSLKQILAFLRKLEEKEREVDMLISNYVYEKAGAKHKKVIHYRNCMPKKKIFTWDELGHFRQDQYILMHSVIYRTELLKACDLTLPKHTFYVDNIYVYYPLPYVKSVYYLDTNFYRYYIGREDQSVNEKVMISRLDQQILVTKTMVDMYELEDLENKKLRTYMNKYLKIMMVVSSILCIRSKQDENLLKKKELWAYLKEKDPRSYKAIRYSAMGIGVNLPGRVGRAITTAGYKIAQKFVGFN